MASLRKILLGAVSLLHSAKAQYFPPTPEEITVLKSAFQESVKFSYKEVC
jgi:hypothetical protein